MTNSQKKLYSVKEVSDLGLIWFKQRKIREFLKDWLLKGIEIKTWERKIVKISQDAIDDFMKKNSSDYEVSK